MNNRFVTEIVEKIKKISGKYNAHIVFSDWVQMTAISISNSCALFHDSIWEEREKAYLGITQKYTKDEVVEMYNMTGLLTLCFEEEIDDYLGLIYMSSGAGNKETGQFFSPFHLSELVAELEVIKDIKNEGNKPIVINEPSCGAGGLILAYAKALKRKNINYQKRMKVVAQDLDWLGVYMTYVQLSLIGIKAIVVQGDTLKEKITDNRHIFYTPAELGMLI